MKDKPILFFIFLLVFATTVIVYYRMATNPLTDTSPEILNSTQHQNPHSFASDSGFLLYKRHCSSCHGPFGGGIAGNPSLQQNTLSAQDIEKIVAHGKGKMPDFQNLSEQERLAVSTFVKQF